MRYNDPSSQPLSGSVIGNSSDPDAATTEQFAAFWGELAKRFVSNHGLHVEALQCLGQLPSEIDSALKPRLMIFRPTTPMSSLVL